MKRISKEAKEEAKVLKALRVVVEFANKWNLTTATELKLVLLAREKVDLQNFQQLLEKMRKMQKERGDK